MPPLVTNILLWARTRRGWQAGGGGRAGERGQGKRGTQENSDIIDGSIPFQEDNECNRPPCLPRPPPTAIHIGICGCVLLLYIQKGRAIHIGSTTLNKQIRHDNQPADLNAFSIFSSFPWCWRPLSSTDTPLALAILAAVYCCHCHAHNCNLAVLQLTPTATC